MKLKASALCVLAAMALSTSITHAQKGNRGAGAKYDFAEFRFVNTEANGRVDGDGISIGGSFRLNREYFLEGSYSDVEFDGGVDANVLSLGGGYIYPYKNFDLVGKARFIDVDVANDSDSGFGLAFGMRHYLVRQLEVRAFFNYVDVGDADTFIELAADYHLNSQLSLGFQFDLGAEDDTWSFGGRYYF